MHLSGQTTAIKSPYRALLTVIKRELSDNHAYIALELSGTRADSVYISDKGAKARSSMLFSHDSFTFLWHLKMLSTVLVLSKLKK